ncbi:cysteine desulfurase/selenocysteine lyase [Herbaspirillum sp. Sphag1AN]|nr:cysteine desulfurase/selenocysteine lyase [Herbaspirillum sp. Sphag1AN]MBB3246423.1 cysteine desulfurase/selenocysteine lyase [Herbaspirillum sp. Sphag64]
MSTPTSLPQDPGGVGQPAPPIDPALLARLATELFAAPPFAPHGVQPPANVAPPASPLASPAGLGQGVPGTAIPLGQVPGTNLIPSSPHQVLALGNRAPALAPAAQAGNGAPDKAFAAIPAYEPRFGSTIEGVPQSVVPSAPSVPALPAGADAGYYFLDRSHGHPLAGNTPSAGAVPATLSLSPVQPSVPAKPAVPASPAQAAAASPSSAPQYYFVHAVELPNGFVTPAKGDPHETPKLAGKSHAAPFDVNAVRRDFPILKERVNGRQLIWFDNAATTQKPQSVIDRISEFYQRENSNIHRAAHELAARATDAYEGARERVRGFLNAPDVNEVIFVRGTTEAINLVAKSWGSKHVGAGDEIIVSHLEHHANIVPWQQLAAEKGAKLRVIPVDDSGQVLLDEYTKLLNDRTKIVAVTQVSNALGTVTPVKEIVELAHRAGAKTLVDGAQSVSHMRTDVQALGADFFVFSGHKVFGPTGIGVLWGKREVLEDMPPWQGGGNMIADVTFEKTIFQPLPNTFEAGTGNIADAVGLGAAIDYVNRIGIENIASYEHALLEYGMEKLGDIPGVRLIGTAAHKASVMSFVLDGYTTEEVGKALNQEGIAVRTGHHCAQPILRRFGVETTVRPSLAFYNTFDEIDCLITVVRRLAGERNRR